MNRVAILSFFLIINTLVFAQESFTVTIDECQQWAVAQSSSNVQKELNQQLLKVKLTDASSHYFPSLEINGMISYQSQTPQLPTSIPGVDFLSKDNYRVGMDLRQVIYDGGKVTYSRKYERLDNENEIHKLDLSINTIKEQIIAIYLNLLIIDKQNNILSTVQRTLNDQMDQLKMLLKEGVIYGNAITQLEVEQLKVEQQQGELLATKESLKSSLSILTGKDLTYAEFVMPDINIVELNTKSDRLEFKIFQNQISGLDYQRKLHYSTTIPQVGFVATGGYGRPTFNFFDNDFGWYYFVGLTFTVPVINWAKTAGVGNIINLQKSILEAQQSDFEKGNQIEIQEKINEIRRIENLLVLDKQIIDKYQELTATYRTQLLSGIVTVYDYLKQQNDETNSLINQEVHRIQLLKAKYELLALKGNL
ncbi:TolC family protein [Bacteroidales bacterium OttesenSCG-928-B11]|nr:TolC family protein [Bacteroidales bacterium OttesenSCG-928-E04]MDL2308710.1 TolC family protein [Bacteroidales bacterium OttesenSCG-928-C03]MDL2311935.1 TolC family protein [Bacteroidales bacterium OttesenSCG-928-B11]